MISRRTYKVISHYARIWYAVRSNLDALGVPRWR